MENGKCTRWFLLPFGQFTLCRACRDEMVCVAVWNLTLRIGREMGAHCAPPAEEKILCRSPFSKRSPVSGLRQTILGKGGFTRGWKPWCLPSCAPAGQARFRSLRKRSTTVWQRLTNNTDNRNFEKAKEEGKNLPLSFTFSEIPADGGAPPDDKSGSPPRRTSPHTRS